MVEADMGLIHSPNCSNFSKVCGYVLEEGINYSGGNESELEGIVETE